MPGDLERELCALPTPIGGLGLSNPTTTVTNHHQASRIVSAPLLIVQQREDLGEVYEEFVVWRNTIKSKRRKEQALAAEYLRERLPPKLKR